MLTSKRLAALGSAALIASLFLSACGGTSGTTSHPPAPSATPSRVALATATPTVSASATPFCGLDVTHPLDIAAFTVADPVGLRTQTAAGQQAFDNQVKALTQPYALSTAGLVEVFGGGADAGTGTDFAQDAITALNLLADQKYIFSHQLTFFQSFWDGSLGNDQIRIQVVFYQCS